MARREPAVPVIFRVYRSGHGKGDAVAIFPSVIGACHDRSVTVYEHVGQHGTARMIDMRQITRPARPSEYRALAKELRRVGYERLRVVKRDTPQYREQRERECRGR